jgi:hypothetical protein
LPKPKKIKVLTHHPRHIETPEVPKLAEGPSSALELSYPAPAEAKMESVEEPKLKIAVEQVKALSPLQETELSKVQKVVSMTPKRRRMASVLDTVMESTKALTPTSAEAPSVEVKNTEKSAEADMMQVEAEAGPSAPAEARPAEIVEKNTESRPSDAAKVPLPLEKEKASEESGSPAPEASAEELEFIVRQASGKNYRRSKLPKLGNMPRI